MENVREILDDLGTDLFKEKLLTLPGKIDAQKTQIRELRETRAEAEQARALKEAEIMSDIISDVNPDTGKPAFSNETARNAERLRRMATDKEYQRVARMAKNMEMQVNQAQDTLQSLYDEFKATQYVAQIVSYEVALFANAQKPGVTASQSPATGNAGTNRKQAQVY